MLHSTRKNAGEAYDGGDERTVVDAFAVAVSCAAASTAHGDCAGATAEYNGVCPRPSFPLPRCDAEGEVADLGLMSLSGSCRWLTWEGGMSSVGAVGSSEPGLVLRALLTYSCRAGS